MLRAIVVIALETFTLMRRDKVFLPAVVAGIVIAALSSIVSDWGISEFEKILVDVAYFGFSVTGGLVAIFWGTKAVTDSRSDGSLEVQLAAPVGRTTWLIAKYAGMVLSLCMLALIFAGVWIVIARTNYFDLLKPSYAWMLGFMLLGWLALAACATLFASFCRQPVAMFATLTLWALGLVSSLVAHALLPGTPKLTRTIVEGVARFWDLQQLSLVRAATVGPWPTQAELGTRGAYGILLVLIMITVACLIFARRDAQPNA
jgi:ABC-type transport system involved in multi-copper enzyme maturation permease subunit